MKTKSIYFLILIFVFISSCNRQPQEILTPEQYEIDSSFIIINILKKIYIDEKCWYENKISDEELFNKLHQIIKRYTNDESLINEANMKPSAF